jgi:diguanylate cyclase (GGDEF)-like protein
VKIIQQFEKWNKTTWLPLGLGLIFGIGIVDFITGYELAFSLFYLLPICAVVWFLGKRFGVLFSVLASIVWFFADYFSGHQYTDQITYIWNTAIRFAFFVIVTTLLSSLKEALEREKALSRIDRLTGAMNGEYFYEIIRAELDRFIRYQHPFTLVYIDLDNFKKVNDQYGHSTGDALLRKVIATIKDKTRKTDIVARMGGDEFAILLLETDSLTAQLIIPRIQQHLLNEMAKSQWSVTFSIGAITFTAAPKSTREIFKLADDQMYTVKQAGKNAVSYSVYSEEQKHEKTSEFDPVS